MEFKTRSGSFLAKSSAVADLESLKVIQKYLGTPTDDILTKFAELSAIPRGSFNLDGVRAYVSNWAKENKFVYRRDKYGNIVVVIGQENDNATNVIIQSHQDIVCEKTHDSKHDFAKDPIQLVIKGDQLHANKTTLGADNGIGLVTSMYVAEKLSQDWLKNNTLYLLMTADEEIGLGGVNNLEEYPFLPKTGYLLNVDSEVTGQVCGGSTGASDVHVTVPIYEWKFENTVSMWSLELNSFKGGHSGIDINKGHANAIKVMAVILDKIRKMRDITLVSINGGQAHNAIATSCSAVFYIESFDPTTIVQETMIDVKRVYNEDKAQFVLKSLGETKTGTGIGNTDDIIDLLLSIHQGIIHMNPLSTDCVYTSNNIGIIKTEKEHVDVNCLIRSDSKSQMQEYHSVLRALARKCIDSDKPAKVSDFSCYTGWFSDWSKSKTLDALKQTYKKRHGQDPRVYTVHAGTECSELVKKYPLWDAQSIGPQINKAHTADEHLIISSVEPFYQWLYDTVVYLGMQD